MLMKFKQCRMIKTMNREPLYINIHIFTRKASETQEVLHLEVFHAMCLGDSLIPAHEGFLHLWYITCKVVHCVDIDHLFILCGDTLLVFNFYVQ